MTGSVAPAPSHRSTLDTTGGALEARPRARANLSFDHELASGTPVGDYIIDVKLGEGAMGAVYRATHPTIGKRVAVKIMTPRLCDDPGAIDRFVREARTLAAIRHPGIVDVFGFGTLTDGRAYLIMDWLDGTSLGARLLLGRLDSDEALDVLDQIARALAAAHDRGITHRDLKPDNVFLERVPGEPPLVKLLDFGLAKLAGDASGVGMTQSGALLGTPLYMSPEQCRGKGVDHRTDIYALGCIGYELLCGRVPFPADNLAELISAHLAEAPPSPRALSPDIVPPLDALLVSMLAKDPQMRPSLPQVRQAITSVRALARATPMPGTVREIGANLSVTPGLRQRRVWTAGGALLIVGAATFAIVMGLRRGNDGDASAPAFDTEPSRVVHSANVDAAAASASTAPAPMIEAGSATTTMAPSTAKPATAASPPRASTIGGIASVATATTKPSVPSSPRLGERRTRTIEYGSLSLEATPSCDIHIDGKALGRQTPQRTLKLPVGRHRITLVNTTHGVNDSFVVEVTADATVKATRQYPLKPSTIPATTINPFARKAPQATP